jgi:hypothetical protein
MRAQDRLDQLVSSDGAGGGTTEMATTAAEYTVRPPAGKIYELQRMNIYIEDNGKFRGDYYGGTKVLGDPIIVSVKDSAGTVIQTLTPQGITKIGQWHLVAGIDMFITDYTTGNDHAGIRWTFTKGSGQPISLNGDAGEYLSFNVQDNLGAGDVALVSHKAQVQGRIRSTVTGADA